MSLRKCSTTVESNTSAAECSTPAPLGRNSSARETPMSTRGSSIFSPGEEFWNEAIQVAHGLSAEKGKDFINAEKDEDHGTVPDGGSSHNFGNGSLKEDLNVVVDDGASSLRQAGLNHSSQDKPTLDKEASP